MSKSLAMPDLKPYPISCKVLSEMFQTRIYSNYFIQNRRRMIERKQKNPYVVMHSELVFVYLSIDKFKKRVTISTAIDIKSEDIAIANTTRE
jgi:hypothetical protein